MRADRLLAVLMLLQARGRMSASALAAATEVSVRTVHRDIQHLSGAGVPVVAVRGGAGGFELMAGWRTSLTGLTTREARAVLLAGAPGVATDLGLEEALRSGGRKLAAAMPSAVRQDSARLSSRFYLDLADWYHERPLAPHLSAVARAVDSGHRLDIRYASWTSTRDRRVEPLGLVLKASSWYLVAGVVPGADEHRVFKVSAILELKERPDDEFTRPAAFDLAAWWERFSVDLDARRFHAEAVLVVDADGLAGVRRWSAAVAEAVERTLTPAAGSGLHRVRVPIESVPHAVGELLGTGGGVEVLSPAELRAAVAEAATRIATRHTSVDPPAPPAPSERDSADEPLDA